MTALVTPAPARRPLAVASGTPSARGVGWVVASEALANVVGFLALVHLTRRLGPEAFGHVEFAAAVSAWLLVLVRGGVDVVVYREAARRPRLIGRLTGLLIGLRGASAAVGLGLAALVAAASGPTRGGLVLVTALILPASAAAPDAGARACLHYRWLAGVQALRTLAYGTLVFALVRGAGDVFPAALALVAAEALCAAAFWAHHASRWGVPLPSRHRRASLVLARRGLLAGLTRFARVTLYAADLLALGAYDGPELGPYAASRRLVFAALGLGLVLPATLGPAFARAWAAGAGPARREVTRAGVALAAAALPASLGLALTADRLMPYLFGAAYRTGGPWLALCAARLPFLLAAGLVQAALLACRREGEALRVVSWSATAALVLLPGGFWLGGPWGLAWGALGAEVVGASVGFVALAQLRLIGPIGPFAVRIGLGCLALASACRLAGSVPLPWACLVGAAAYAAVWCGFEARGRGGVRWPTG